MEERVRVFLSESEYETLLECVPRREVRIPIRIQAECSLRPGKVVSVRLSDFFIPDNPEVEIVFLRIRESKDTTEGENALGGGVRISWVPYDLYQEVEQFCEDEGIDDDEEIFSCDYERYRQLVNDTAENAATRTGNEDFEHVAPHDFRAYYATNMVRRLRVKQELVMEMGDWDSKRAMEPYLDMSQPKDLQDGLARAGVLQKDVSAPPRRDELTVIYEELQEIKRRLALEEVTSIDGVTMDLLERVKETHTTDEQSDAGKGMSPSHEQVSIHRALDDEQVNSYLPPFGWAAMGGEALSTRLQREWKALTGGTEWLSPVKMVKVGALYTLFVIAVGVHLGLSGVYIDPTTLTFYASFYESVAIVFGLAVGTVGVLLPDHHSATTPQT